jgi:hypothetical protein
MEASERMDIHARVLDHSISRGEWSASRPRSFTHRERAPGTNWM